MTATAEEKKFGVALDMVMAVADAIRELGEVPAGHLYARMMGHIDLQTFDWIIDKLVGAKVVARDPSHLLRWIGPTKKEGDA